MIVSVSLTIPVSKTFSYSVPPDWEPFIRNYMRVTVPFRNRVLKGYIVGADHENDESLKGIKGLTDLFPLLNEPLAGLCIWASHHYAVPLGLILRFAVPQNLQPEQYLLIRSLSSHTSLLDGTALKKALKSADRCILSTYYHNKEIDLYDVFTGKPFTPFLQETRQIGNHNKTLLLGNMAARVGYYVEQISHSMENGKKVLMLLPDYLASGHFFHKIISGRFKDKVFWYGSPGRTKKRMEAYFKAQSNESCIIMGNKSAVFLPMINNGLILVERSEEDGYRNEDGVNFNSWMIALKRAEIDNIPISFGSVSPPLDVWKAAEDNKINIIDRSLPLKHIRMNTAKVRSLSVPGKLPDELCRIISDAAMNNENVAIFTPRKDYASHLLCLDCKKSFSCKRCGGNLGYQKRSDLLICSACGKGLKYDDKCPGCGSSIIRFSQTGTEYIEEKLRAAFSGFRIVKVTGESLANAVDVVSDDGASGASPTIFVGTQALSKLYMINAKHLILFGWEELAGMSGYRAAERMHQMLMNLVDAVEPESISFFMDEKKAVEPERFMSRTDFYTEELKRRRFADYPPYVRLFLIEMGKNSNEALQKLIKKVQIFLQKIGAEKYIAGMLLQKRGQGYQYRIILKIPDGDAVPEGLSGLYDLSGLKVEPDPQII